MTDPGRSGSRARHFRMSYYFVVNSTVTDPAGFGAYRTAVGPTFDGHELKVHVATDTAGTIEGSSAGQRLVILEFPSETAFRAWYDSPAYQAVIGLRLNSTAGFALVAEGQA
jgi:uncharacterized protein (DUF1330 family)